MTNVLHRDLRGDDLHPPGPHTHPDTDLSSLTTLDARYKTAVYNEVPAGALNNTNTVFTLAYPYAASSTRLFLNGLRMKLGSAYSESGVQQITLSEAPHAGDELIIDYTKA